MGYGVLGWKLMSKGSYMKLVFYCYKHSILVQNFKTRNLGQQINVRESIMNINLLLNIKILGV